MTPVLTSEQMRAADRRAIDELGIPSPVLMENAARGAWEVVHNRLGGARGRRVLAICGHGNNGGDGIALLRHALIDGAEVRCALLSDPSALGANAAAQLRMLSAFSPTTISHWRDVRASGERFDAIVDAALGTGAHGALRDEFREAMRWANELTGVKIALDVPTGVDADKGSADPDAFRADATATMGTLKPGLVIGRGRVSSGDVTVVHIGVPESHYSSADIGLLDAAEAMRGVRVVDPGWYKYRRGKVLVIAGSRGMAGAGAMAAEAALRSGSGLVVFAVPSAAVEFLHALPPEIMARHLASGHDGAVSVDAFDQLDEELERYDAVAIGPGLSKTPATDEFVERIAAAVEAPLVIDADAIATFATGPEKLAERRHPTIITPHHGEIVRLGYSAEQVADDPIGTARDAAKRTGAITVLKGAPTIVALPDGRAWINSAGNPGMATGGTGDVLTGMIGSFVAKSEDVPASVLAAVYLHSLAGDIAVEHGSVRSMTATDIIGAIPAAYRRLCGQ